MRRFPILLAMVTIGLLTTRTDAEDTIDFDRQVRPILDRHCVACHGADRARGGLRLDSAAGAITGGDLGPAVVPGQPDESELLLAVLGEGATAQMPLDRPPLPADEIATLRGWIQSGALAPDGESPAEISSDHWSLQPPRDAEPPDVDDEQWSRHPIDRFVLASLNRAGIAPSPEADRATLIRRLSLDLTGLPPTPEEIDAFLNDDRPNAYNRLVDRLLGSPRYGERWAQHWLDVIRWAETWGFETNSPRPNAWPYRDWVIRSLNEDLPYNRFLFEQLAGDTLGADAATGLLVSGPANLPGQIGKDEESIRQARQDELDESIRTVGSAFMGLTIGCARCHSHKFDPITQRDYYAFQALFSGLQYGDRRFRGPEDDQWAARASGIRQEIEAARDRLESARESLGLRPSLSPSYHEDRFDPIEATAVRIVIEATHNGGRASLDELEAWEPSSLVNVALAERGGHASASSFALENQTRHPDNLIDGKSIAEGYFPWIAERPGPAWARIDLDGAVTIDRVAWSRGFDGFPVDYVIEVLRPDGSWVAVADTKDRMLHEEDRRSADAVSIVGASPGDLEQIVSLLSELRNKEGEYQRLAAGPQVFSGSFTEPATTYLLRRGDPMQLLEPMPPDTLAVLGSLDLSIDAEDSDRRVALASHLTSPDHPLTARVMVNRVWQHHFGTGIVATPSDFGRMGEPPSHPELLDWLSINFVRNDWSLKGLHRLILTSRTYRQASTPRHDALAIDSDARLLWRFPPRRLEAEAIRDAILAVSGALNDQMAGPGFDFFNQKGGLSDYIPVEEFGPSGWRRMIYATKIRMQAVDVFGAFDCPDAGQMTPKRSQSITPIQSLSLWNSPFVIRQASIFSDRVRAESGPDLQQQIDRATRLAIGRAPTGAEESALMMLGREHGLDQVCRVLLNTNEFVLIP
jgi:hypothetical protein